MTREDSIKLIEALGGKIGKLGQRFENIRNLKTAECAGRLAKLPNALIEVFENSLEADKLAALIAQSGATQVSVVETEWEASTLVDSDCANHIIDCRNVRAEYLDKIREEVKDLLTVAGACVLLIKPTEPHADSQDSVMLFMVSNSTGELVSMDIEKFIDGIVPVEQESNNGVEMPESYSDKLQADYTTALSEIADKNERLEQVQALLEEKDIQLQELTAQLQSANEQLQSSSPVEIEDFQDAKERAENAEEELTKAQAELARTNDILEEVKAELKEVKSQFKDLDKENDGLREEAKQALDSAESYRLSLENTQKQVDNLLAEKAALQQQVQQEESQQQEEESQQGFAELVEEAQNFQPEEVVIGEATNSGEVVDVTEPSSEEVEIPVISDELHGEMSTVDDATVEVESAEETYVEENPEEVVIEETLPSEESQTEEQVEADETQTEEQEDSQAEEQLDETQGAAQTPTDPREIYCTTDGVTLAYLRAYPENYILSVNPEYPDYEFYSLVNDTEGRFYQLRISTAELILVSPNN